jgi:hypothetical protein
MRDRNERSERDRSVSVALTHVLTLAITIVLLTGLVVGAGQLLDDQEDRAARDQFSGIGSDVVSHIHAVDRLGRTGESVTVTVRPTYPDRVVGAAYTVNITDDQDRFPFETTHALEVRSAALENPIQYPLDTDAALNASIEARGGEVPICLRDDEIAIGEVCL